METSGKQQQTSHTHNTFHNSIEVENLHTPLTSNDFDPQLSLASDKIATSSEPVLRLNLTLENDDQTTKDVVVELSRSELDKLIASLQHANQVHDCRSPPGCNGRY